MKPSSSSGSQHSLIKISTSSRSNFSPRDRRICSSSPSIMVPFSILSYSFKHSMKSSNEPVSLLLSPTQFVNHLQSWVEIQTTEAVTKIKHIHPRLALKVIDVEGKFCTFYVLCIKISHFELFVPLCSLTTIEGEDRTEVPC